MRTAYIMRGIPGSGKSTAARRLTGPAGALHSTDEYFVVDGVYRFDATRLPEYHARNLAAFKRSLQDGHEVVACDNTNVQLWHMEPYIAAATEHGYTVTVIEMPHPDPATAARRNLHGTPIEVIKEMISLWESYPGAIIYDE